MFVVLWLAVTAFGLAVIAMGRRVYSDPDWEAGDWWAFDSWLMLRGLVFAVLFPTARDRRATRRAERCNATLVVLWGVLLVAVGVALLWYEVRG